MQENPDVNSLSIGDEPESHPETTRTGGDAEKVNIEGVREHASRDIEKNQSNEERSSTEQPENNDDSDTR
jgi:hypothetical protein